MSTAKGNARRRRLILKPDPLGVPRNPLAIYLLALATVSGIATLFGFPVSQSIELELVPLAQQVWGGLLGFGAMTVLLGMYWQGIPPTGLLLKRVGILVLFVASTTYGAAILAAFGWSGVTSAMTILGFSVACLVQYRALDSRVKAILAESEHPGILDRLADNGDLTLQITPAELRKLARQRDD